MISITVSSFSEKFPDLAAQLTKEELDALFHTFDVLDIGAGEALIAEGTLTDSLFLVWNGELDVSIDTPNGEQEIAHVGPGAFLGEVSLMDPGPATASVITQKGCIVLSLNHHQLQTLWEEHTHLAIIFLHRLAQVVADRIRAANAFLDNLLSENKPVLSPDVVVEAHTLLYQPEKV
jgi:CRP/FNR family cyclic AMP-dependent transcriptional regulator